jgi:type I site-specific restriction endonuclease
MTHRLPRLSFPAYDLRVREVEGKQMVYDRLRRTYVRLTPEEWVRQHAARYLTDALGVPPGLLGVEVAVGAGERIRRADLVAHDRHGQALLLVECKAPSVPIAQATFDQAARYNRVAEAPFLYVTNGRVHYACRVDRASGAVRFLDDLPDYAAMMRARADA